MDYRNYNVLVQCIPTDIPMQPVENSPKEPKLGKRRHSDAEDQKPKKKKEKKFRCELCNVRLAYSEELLQKHLQSKEHVLMTVLLENGLWPGKSPESDNQQIFEWTSESGPQSKCRVCNVTLEDVRAVLVHQMSQEHWDTLLNLRLYGLFKRTVNKLNYCQTCDQVADCQHYPSSSTSEAKAGDNEKLGSEGGLWSSSYKEGKAAVAAIAERKKQMTPTLVHVCNSAGSIVSCRRFGQITSWLELPTKNLSFMEFETVEEAQKCVSGLSGARILADFQMAEVEIDDDTKFQINNGILLALSVLGKLACDESEPRPGRGHSLCVYGLPKDVQPWEVVELCLPFGRPEFIGTTDGTLSFLVHYRDPKAATELSTTLQSNSMYLRGQRIRCQNWPVEKPLPSKYLPVGKFWKAYGSMRHSEAIAVEPCPSSASSSSSTAESGGHRGTVSHVGSHVDAMFLSSYPGITAVRIADLSSDTRDRIEEAIEAAPELFKDDPTRPSWYRVDWNKINYWKQQRDKVEKKWETAEDRLEQGNLGSKEVVNSWRDCYLELRDKAQVVVIDTHIRYLLLNKLLHQLPDDVQETINELSKDTPIRKQQKQQRKEEPRLIDSEQISAAIRFFLRQNGFLNNKEDGEEEAEEKEEAEPAAIPVDEDSR